MVFVGFTAPPPFLASVAQSTLIVNTIGHVMDALLCDFSINTQRVNSIHHRANGSKIEKENGASSL